MPIFEYKCADCGAKFDELVGSPDEKVPPKVSRASNPPCTGLLVAIVTPWLMSQRSFVDGRCSAADAGPAQRSMAPKLAQTVRASVEAGFAICGMGKDAFMRGPVTC